MEINKTQFVNDFLKDKLSSYTNGQIEVAGRGYYLKGRIEKLAIGDKEGNLELNIRCKWFVRAKEVNSDGNPSPSTSWTKEDNNCNFDLKDYNLSYEDGKIYLSAHFRYVGEEMAIIYHAKISDMQNPLSRMLRS
jgi:hypothetical protein